MVSEVDGEETFVVNCSLNLCCRIGMPTINGDNCRLEVDTGHSGKIW
jgi:hypothetical protein